MKSILLLLAFAGNLVAADPVRVTESFEGAYVVEWQENNAKLFNPRNAKQVQLVMRRGDDPGSRVYPKEFAVDIIETFEDAVPRIETAYLSIVGSEQQFEPAVQRYVEIYHVVVHGEDGGEMDGILKRVKGRIFLCFTSDKSAFRPRTFDTSAGSMTDPIMLMVGRSASPDESKKILDAVADAAAVAAAADRIKASN